MPKEIQPNSRADVIEGLPHRSDTALLLVDIVTDFDFEDGDKLWKSSRTIARPIAELRARARDLALPVVYVNDNFGNWQEDLERQVDRIMQTSSKGRELLEHIRPGKEDFYVLKPQRSGFYETPLSVLLSSMEISSLIIAGVTTDICVLFTAHDAYMRGFDVMVPSDCTAAVDEAYKTQALELMARVAKVETKRSPELDLKSLAVNAKK